MERLAIENFTPIAPAVKVFETAAEVFVSGLRDNLSPGERARVEALKDLADKGAERCAKTSLVWVDAAVEVEVAEEEEEDLEGMDEAGEKDGVELPAVVKLSGEVELTVARASLFG